MIMMYIQYFVFVSCILTSVAYDVHYSRYRRSSNEVTIQELEIVSNVAIRYAKVLVRSLMINRKISDQEAKFQVRLPREAYITSFEIETDNKTIKAVIKEKKQAQEEYEKAKKDNVTAGLVSQQKISDDIDIDVFKIEVNVAAGATVEFRLEYEEFLLRKAGKYTQKIFIDSEQVVPNLGVKCSFKEKQKFKTLFYTTPYSTQQNSFNKGIETSDGYFVNVVDWKPSESDQEQATNGLETPFEIEYELQIDENGGMLFLNNDGQFVHLFSVPCNESKIMSKQIVFVIDISGSMSGNPIKQVRQAMSSILSELRSNDYFNIVIFDDKVTNWRSSFQLASSVNLNSAQEFVRQNVRASGPTNINDALQRALGLFDTNALYERFGQIIVFLTDGSPTHGVTDTSTILKNVASSNYGLQERCCKSIINTIAFGRNADVNFLSSVAYQNSGTLTIIKEIEGSIADSELIEMYETTENPYFKNLYFSFEADNEVMPETNITLSHVLQFDCGSEVVVSGWTTAGADVHPTVRVSGVTDDIVFNAVPTIIIENEESVMLARLVVYQRVKQLLMESASTMDVKRKDAANKLALELSLKYGFVTPLTSLVVTNYPTDNSLEISDNRIYASISYSPKPFFNSMCLIYGYLVSVLVHT